MNVTKRTVIKWLKQKDYQEKRGWQSGKARKYTDPSIATRICELKQKRKENKKYFQGSEYILMDYANQYPKEKPPKLWYIDKVVRDAGLQTKKPKQKKRGGSKYLLYPVQCIKNLGTIHQSSDFIGKKYITGSSDPVNIFSSSYYRPFKLYQIQRILAEKAIYVIEQWKEQWIVYPKPDVERLDNGLQFRGTASGKRALGTTLRFLLNLDVTPLFGAPSKPWTNPHVEGHNRVFNEKVWGTNWFTDLLKIDTECNRFNEESLEYFHFKYSELIFNGNFQYLERNQNIRTDILESKKNKKVYFIRFVESFEKTEPGHIVVMNETIPLLEKYTHQFVFVEWDIGKEHINIYSEFERNITLIKSIRFRLNI